MRSIKLFRKLAGRRRESSLKKLDEQIWQLEQELSYRRRRQISAKYEYLWAEVQLDEVKSAASQNLIRLVHPSVDLRIELGHLGEAERVEAWGQLTLEYAAHFRKTRREFQEAQLAPRAVGEGELEARLEVLQQRKQRLLGIPEPSLDNPPRTLVV